MPGRGLRFTAVITEEDGTVLDRHQFTSAKDLAEWLDISHQYVRVMFAAGLGTFQRTRTVDGKVQTCTVTREPRNQF